MMDEKRRYKIMRAGINIYESLQMAVSEAGGTGFTLEVLENMSAMKLLTRLAPNHIKFVYKEPDEESKV